MAVFDSFHYWIGVTEDPDGTFTSTYQALQASGDQLLVVEPGGVTSDAISDVLTPAQLDVLEAQGRTVLGYVNVMVTDHNRSYWNDLWVVPEDRGGLNPDAGTPSDDAPDWFADPIAVASGPGGEIYGPVVDFRDPDWQEIVITQAVDVVEAGYSGVFLDDVARYYQGDVPLTAELADEVMQLVNRVADAVHAVDPEAAIIVNGGPYLRWNADSATGNAFSWWEYLSNVDGFVYEYVETGQSPGNWPDFTANYFDLVNFLYIVDDDVASSANIAEAVSEGVSVEIVPDPDYDDAPPPGTVTPPADAPLQSQQVWIDGVLTTLVYGTMGNDLIDLSASTGAAIIYGRDGDDTIIGTGYDDLIFAGTGDDSVMAGAGDDIVLAGAGADSVYGEAGGDTISGGSGGDLLSGGDGPDALYGDALPDDILL